MRVLAAALTALAALAGACAGGGPDDDGARARAAGVERVVDGDTLVLVGGARVRLVQIDTPELDERECYAARAADALRDLVDGRSVRLRADPALDRVDGFGRLLRYVLVDGRNVNVEMVRRGAAAPWFFDGDRGRYADALLGAARAARRAGRGLWGACPGARLAPDDALTTEAPAASAGGRRCDPSYPDVCIRPPPPDLSCADVGATDIRVRPPDPHGLDGNGDGVGCEPPP